MAINLITSNTLRGVDEQLFSRIKQENNNISPIIIIVPDQYTQAVERELFRAIGIKCSFNIEVLSFYRLAKKLMPTGKAELNQQTAVLLLSKIIKTHAGSLRSYRTVAARRSFAGEMYAVITSIRNNCVSSEALSAAVAGMGGKSGERYADIALIYSEYMRALYADYSDISTLLDSFVRAVPSLSQLKTTSIYMTGFSGMTKNKRAIVEALMDNAGSFTLGVCDINGQSNCRLMPRDMQALIDLALVRGCSRESSQDSCMAGEQEHFAREVFSYTLSKYDGDNKFFDSIAMRSKDEEIRYLAADIRRRIVGGARYRDIAVVSENLTSYAGLIAKYFTDYEVPFFIDDKVTAARLPKYKFLMSTLALIKGGCLQGDVLRLVKERLFDATDDDKNMFENYILKYSISHGKVLRDYTFGDDEERLAAERVRIKLQFYLGIMTTNSQDIVVNLDAITRLFACLDGVDRGQYLVDGDWLGTEFVSIGDSKITTVMEQIRLMMQGAEASVAGCIELVLDTIASVKISLAPINIDCVFVGAVGESRLESVNYLYMIGAKEDTYPSAKGDNGMLREHDLAALASRGIDLEGSVADKSKSSKYEIIQLLTRARESLVLTYPAGGGRGVMIGQLNYMFNRQDRLVDVCLSHRDNLHQLATKIGTKSNFMNIMGDCYKGRGKGIYASVAPYIYSHCDSDVIEGVVDNISDNYIAYGGKVCFKDNFLKISGIEEFYRCPFAYYGGVILKLQEREDGKVDVASMGEFIHRMLELYFTHGYHERCVEDKTECVEKKTLMPIIDAAKELVAIIMDEEKFLSFKAQDESGKLAEYLTVRCGFILGEMIGMLKRSAFKPTHFECKFGMKERKNEAINNEYVVGMKESENAAISIAVGDKTYKVRGYIDRIDVSGDVAALVDYKSSSKELDIDKVFLGQKIQLVLYLDAAMNMGYNRCGGIYYFALPYKYKKDVVAEDLRYSYSGFINADKELMKAQDSDYDNGRKSFLPIGYSKKSGIYTPLNDFAAGLTDEKFERVRAYVKRLLSKTIDTIEGGYIAPSPIEDGCDYCRYGDLCRASDIANITRSGESVVWKGMGDEASDGNGSEAECQEGDNV